MAKKITKREKYEMLKALPAVAENEMLVEFIDHELELLDRKNAPKDGEVKLTAKQTENEAVKSEILNYMEMGTKYTVSSLLEGVPNQPEDMSHHRMVALLKQLVDAEAVTKTKEKGVTYFALSD
jgi:DNA-binding transcriptional regulator GbsR (MarR family)